MMKTALQVVYNNYPYITRFTLEDETHYNNIELNKPHITAKRLLIGTPGWYQQHFGAEPEKTTVELIEYIKIKRIEINNVIRKITPQNSGEEWWTTENILKLINNIRPDIVNNMLYNISTRIFGTEWFIRRNTIGLYNMKYSIKNVDILSDINQDNFYKNYINIHERK